MPIAPQRSPEEKYRSSAATLRREMMRDGERSRTLQVHELLSEFFALRRPTDETMAAVRRAMEAEDLFVPPIAGLTAETTVRLGHETMRGIEWDVPSEVDLRVTLWHARQPPEEVAVADHLLMRKKLTWVSIEVPDGDAAPHADALWEILKWSCPGLSREMVADLLEADNAPDIKRWSDAVTSVSVRGYVAEQGPVTGSHAGRLRRQLVEIFAGERWVVTAHHGSERIGASGRAVAEPSDARAEYDRLRKDLENVWTVQPEPEDGRVLATILLRVLVNGYVNVRRTLYEWLDRWEAAFDGGEEKTDPTTLVEVRRMMMAMRQDIVALSAPQGREPHCAWYTVPVGTRHVNEVDAAIQTSLHDLRNLADGLRASFDLIATRSAARTLEVVKRGQSEAEKLNRTLQLIGVSVLGPALVAAFLSVQPQFLLLKPHLIKPHLVGVVVLFAIGVLLTATAAVIIAFASRLLRSAAPRFKKAVGGGAGRRKAKQDPAQDG